MPNISRKILSYFRLTEKQSRSPRAEKTYALLALRDLGIPISTVIDVGAQTGTESLIKGFPEHYHLLVEPLAEWNSQLRQRYKSHPGGFSIVNEAASDEDGTAILKLRDVLGAEHHSHAFMINDGEEAVGEHRRVGAARLDSLLATHELPGPYLLKVDVDGPDMRVIAGAQETLKNTNIIVIESGVNDLLQRSIKLRDLGFELFNIVDLCYYGDRLAQVDLIFLRREIFSEHKLDFAREKFDPQLWRELRSDH